MADEAKPSAVSCVNALTAFLENGKALLEFAEKESSEGRQHLVRQVIKIDLETACSAGGNLSCPIYGRDVSRGSRQPVNH